MVTVDEVLLLLSNVFECSWAVTDVNDTVSWVHDAVSLGELAAGSDDTPMDFTLPQLIFGLSPSDHFLCRLSTFSTVGGSIEAITLLLAWLAKILPTPRCPAEGGSISAECCLLPAALRRCILVYRGQ